MNARKSRGAANAALIAAIALGALSLPSCNFFNSLFGPAEVGTPTNVRASQGTSADGITLSWEAVRGAASYLIYRSDSYDYDPASSGYVKIGESKTNSYSDAEVPADVNFWYTVSAVSFKGNEGSQSGHSCYGSRRGSGGAAAIPYSVTASEGKYGKIDIGWSVDPSVKTVAIYFGRAEDGSDMAFMANSADGGYTYSSSLLMPGVADSIAGVKFYFRIKGVSESDSSVMSAFSPQVVGCSFGGAPTGFTASQGTYSSRVALSWDSAPGATDYYACRTNYLGGPVTWSKEVRTVTSADDTTAVQGQRYYYAVQAIAKVTPNTLSSAFSLPIIGYSQVNSGLSAPSDLHYTRASRFAVDLAWSSVSGASGYRLYRCLSADGVFDFLADSAGLTSYTDYGLSASTAYHYRATSYSGAGESALGPVFSVTTPATSSLSTPANPHAIPGSAPTTSLSLTWDASSGASGYRVYRATSSDGAYALLGLAPAAAYEDSGLSPDTHYYYKVSAYSASDDSDLCSPFFGWTNPPVPLVPINRSADMSGIGHISVYWKPVQYAVSYKIQRWNETTAAYDLLSDDITSDDTVQVTYDDGSTALRNGIPRYYRIAAVNRLGEAGPWSKDIEGMLSPWGFDTPLLQFMSATDNPAATPHMTAAFQWTDLMAVNNDIGGYTIFKTEVTIENGSWTYGKYSKLVDDASNGYTLNFADADRGKIFSYLVAARHKAGGIGPKSRPLDITVGRNFNLPMTDDPTDDPDYGLSSALTYGMVYGSTPMTYTFTLPACAPEDDGLFVFLEHYNLLNQYAARISIQDAVTKEYFHAKSQVGTIFKDMPVNGPMYRQNGYQIWSDTEKTVILTVSLSDLDPTKGSVNYKVWVAETPTIRPF